MADLASQLALAKRIIDRLPLCPDHRDKVRGRCLECVNAALLEALEAVMAHVCADRPRITFPSNGATADKARAAIRLAGRMA